MSEQLQCHRRRVAVELVFPIANSGDSEMHTEFRLEKGPDSFIQIATHRTKRTHCYQSQLLIANPTQKRVSQKNLTLFSCHIPGFLVFLLANLSCSSATLLGAMTHVCTLDLPPFASPRRFI
jgi:hypothetical protein